MRALYRFFRSVPLAVVLILLIVLLSILATLVPRISLFSSPIFLVPVGLFAVSLSVCTVDRLVKRGRAGARRRHGPDLIHAGLLLLITGGIVTTALRQERVFFLAEGESAKISPSVSLTLTSFEYQKYENGSPKAWISTVRLERDGAVTVPTSAIAVNHPLRLSGLRVYQASFNVEGKAVMKAENGELFTVETGQGFREGKKTWYFAEAERSAAGAWTAHFQQWEGRALASTQRITAGGMVGPYAVARVTGRLSTGLKVVRDPGALPVIAAFGVIGIGLALTFIQKRGDGKQ